MNDAQKTLARISFQNKIYSKYGLEFEHFFTQIMNYAYKDFKQIKPQGQIGDRKNDGYIPTQGVYYQVYAPENPSSGDTPTKAVKKAKQDFDGLMKYWKAICEPKEYYFVFNDKFSGVFPEIEKILSEIQQKHKLGKCKVFLAKDIEDICFSKLSDDQIQTIIGFIPFDDSIDILDYSIVSQVIGYIMKNIKPINLQNWEPPEFDGKIKYNNLSNEIKSILDSAYYHCGTLEEYFENNSDFARQEVRDRIKSTYSDVVKDFINRNIKNKSDHVFMEIAGKLMPSNSSNNKQQKHIQDAVFVLMAFYFSSCDIFENSPEKKL